MSAEKTTGLWTPANVVTCIRVAFVPLWLLAAELCGGTGMGGVGVFVFFCLLSATDSLDGYLARSRNEVTDFGKFLDPIADKLVVVVALCYLLEQGIVGSWVVLVVVAREFLVSGLRMVVAADGVVVAASMLGKLKTASTMGAIGGLLLAVALPQDSFVTEPLLLLSNVVLVIAMVLTAWSGIDYFVKCWPHVSGQKAE